MSRTTAKDVDSRITEAAKELKELENHIFEMESRFLSTYSKNSSNHNDSYYNSKAKPSYATLNRKNGRTIKISDRIFSLSSTSRPFNEKDDVDPGKLPPFKRSGNEMAKGKTKKKAKIDEDSDF